MRYQTRVERTERFPPCFPRGRLEIGESSLRWGSFGPRLEIITVTPSGHFEGFSSGASLRGPTVWVGSRVKAGLGGGLRSVVPVGEAEWKADAIYVARGLLCATGTAAAWKDQN
ncbi:hypothetical protein KM043_001947 [Ampulex compressa]|nr:hypothetical protein KM043_001947 [Ampulex compressa]